MKNLITRFSQNPILERDTIAGYDSMFNPGAIRYGDKIILAVRAARDNRLLIGGTKRNYLYSNQVCDHLIFEGDEDGEIFKFTGRKMTGSAANWLDGYTGEISVPTYYGPYGSEDLRLCQVGQEIVGIVHVNTHEPYRGDHKAGERKIDKPSIQVAFFKNLEELIKAPPSY